MARRADVARNIHVEIKETPTPTDDKERPFACRNATAECGRVYIVEGSWNDDFWTGFRFPVATACDEFVDILGYAINDLYEED